MELGNTAACSPQAAAGLTNCICFYLYKNQQFSAATAGVLRDESLAGPSYARRMEGGVAGLR